MAIGPDGDEIWMCVADAANVRVVALTPGSQLFLLVPSRAIVNANPHGEFSAGVEGLWSRLRRRDQTPLVSTFNPKLAKIIVVIRRRDLGILPLGSGPAGNRPGARVVFWTGLVSLAR